MLPIKKILLVDDNDDQLRVWLRMDIFKDTKIHYVFDGETMLEYFETQCKDGDYPDLVFLDCFDATFGSAMSGARNVEALVEWFSKNHPTTPLPHLLLKSGDSDFVHTAIRRLGPRYDGIVGGTNSSENLLTELGRRLNLTRSTPPPSGIPN